MKCETIGIIDLPEDMIIREEIQQMNMEYRNSLQAWAESHNEIPN